MARLVDCYDPFLGLCGAMSVPKVLVASLKLVLPQHLPIRALSGDNALSPLSALIGRCCGKTSFNDATKTFGTDIAPQRPKNGS